MRDLALIPGLQPVERWLNPAGKAAPRRARPVGSLIHVRGGTLHYVDRGAGQPIVMLHGTGSMVEELICSGLVDRLAEKFRVLAFDRPGHGYSSSCGSNLSPQAQADIIADALATLEISDVVLVGHSWGALVGVNLALRHKQAVAALALVCGCFYPVLPPWVTRLLSPIFLLFAQALGLSVGPLIGRLFWPLSVRLAFYPEAIPERFNAFPKQLVFRSRQMGVTAAELAYAAGGLGCEQDYTSLTLPAVIVAGRSDRIVQANSQSRRLHRDLANSNYYEVVHGGHMLHQTRPDFVLAAIEEAAEKTRDLKNPPRGQEGLQA